MKGGSKKDPSRISVLFSTRDRPGRSHSSIAQARFGKNISQGIGGRNFSKSPLPPPKKKRFRSWPNLFIWSTFPFFEVFSPSPYPVPLPPPQGGQGRRRGEGRERKKTEDRRSTHYLPESRGKCTTTQFDDRNQSSFTIRT